MKRIAILLLSTLTLLTLLTGCIHEDFGIKLNADGTGSVSARIGIDKDVYNQALGMGADLFSDSEAEPTEYEYKGKTYVSVTETTEYASFDELKQALLDLTYETDELAQLNDLEAAGEPVEEEAEALIAEFLDIFDGESLARSTFERVCEQRHFTASRNVRLTERRRLRYAIDAKTAHVVEFVGSVDGLDIVFLTVGIDANRRFCADERCPCAHGIALRTDENAVGRGENRAVGLERGERENGFFSLLTLGESDHEGQHINQSRDDSFHSFL